MPRRTLFSGIAIAVLIGAYFVTKSMIRAHVDALIKGAVDRPLPAFALVDRDGRSWTLADLTGRRVVLHFFRSRCGSCDVEAPAMRRLEQELPQDVVMLHVMTDAVMDFAPELTAATLQHKRFTRPVLMADAAFMDAFHTVKWSQVTPITYVVDAAGVVRFGLRGGQDESSVQRALAAVR
ncbi:MAG: redoxin domain-containing protein [Planctomycetes bacterium]|nr:redoxin domain-containing protein [Planctomycetota bacterium]